MEHSSRTYQSFRIRRMDLREFSEFVQSCINPIITASQTFDGMKEPLTSEDKIQYFISENVITSLDIVDECCRKFHDNIEFSTYLPLTVVPFLLPLLALLKKAIVQAAYARIFITRSKSDKEYVCHNLEEMNILKGICDELVVQARFILQKARFQEKILKQAG